MRIVMMGTGPFAAPTLQALLENPAHEVPALVTRPAVARRGRAAPPSPMRLLAEQANLPILDPPDVNAAEFQPILAELACDLMVVCDYGQILSSQTLSAAPLGGINLHGSLLPRYRGAAPVQWAVYHGEKITGVTVIHMTPRLDGGPCLVAKATEIGSCETAGQLEPRLAELGAPTVLEAIDMLADWNRTSPLGETQDSSLATKAPRLKKSDGEVDWNRTAEEIFNQVRAFQPWPGTFTHWLRPGGEPLRVILNSVSPQPEGGKPGSVIAVDESQLCIAAAKGSVCIHQIQPAGKREMEISEFLRGHKPGIGDCFSGEIDANDTR